MYRIAILIVLAVLCAGCGTANVGAHGPFEVTPQVQPDTAVAASTPWSGDAR